MRRKQVFVVAAVVVVSCLGFECARLAPDDGAICLLLGLAFGALIGLQLRRMAPPRKRLQASSNRRALQVAGLNWSESVVGGFAQSNKLGSRCDRRMIPAGVANRHSPGGRGSEKRTGGCRRACTTHRPLPQKPFQGYR
ncbi:MAG TPA: hypothetical protein VH595_16245 [Verrucomicrobiae bacterium]|nr:hypothetical protein [Verrucomicrobiae bacterium]